MAQVMARREDRRSEMLPFAQYLEKYLIQNTLQSPAMLWNSLLAAIVPSIRVSSVSGLQQFLRANDVNDFQGAEIQVTGTLDRSTVCGLFTFLEEREFQESMRGSSETASGVLRRLRAAVYPYLRINQADARFLEAVAAIHHSIQLGSTSELQQRMLAADHVDYRGDPVTVGSPFDQKTLFALFSYMTGDDAPQPAAAPRPVLRALPRRVDGSESTLPMEKVLFPVPGADRLVENPDSIYITQGGKRTALGYYRSNYGEMRHGLAHEGLDIHAPLGSPILSPADGRITVLEVTEKGGNTVTIRSSDNTYFRMVHMNTIEVREGQRIARGQRIGTVGMSGTITPHLHIAVYRIDNGKVTTYNPIDLFEH
ncbi:MAG: M23 family metallopeptidase [Candidatus Micrarchaeia archaeon]